MYGKVSCVVKVFMKDKMRNWEIDYIIEDDVLINIIGRVKNNEGKRWEVYSFWLCCVWEVFIELFWRVFIYKDECKMFGMKLFNCYMDI